MIYLPPYIIPSFRYDLAIVSFILHKMGLFIHFFAFGLLKFGFWFTSTSNSIDYYRYITIPYSHKK